MLRDLESYVKACLCARHSAVKGDMSALLGRVGEFRHRRKFVFAFVRFLKDRDPHFIFQNGLSFQSVFGTCFDETSCRLKSITRRVLSHPCLETS